MFGLNAGEDIVLVAACSRAVKKGRRPVAVNSLAGLPIYQRDRAVVIRFEDIRVIRLHMEPPVRIVVPPQPCTFRKYCAQSEKRVTSPNCKQTTQPSGAATPRDSDAHKRIAVPKALCVLCEHTRSRPKSGKTCRSDTRPGDVGERAERSESSDTTPHPKRPLFRRVSRCVRSFSESRVCTRFHS